MEAEISVMDLQEKQQQESWVFPSSWKRGMEQMVRALRTSEPSEVTTLPTPWFHITSLLKGKKKNLFFYPLSQHFWHRYVGFSHTKEISNSWQIPPGYPTTQLLHYQQWLVQVTRCKGLVPQDRPTFQAPPQTLDCHLYFWANIHIAKFPTSSSSVQ